MLDIIAKIKRKLGKKHFKYFGNNSYVHFRTQVKNTKYIEIGNDVFINGNGIIEAWDKYNNKVFTPRIVIGSGTMINSCCHIGAINYIEIGNDCLFGSNVMIIDHSHGRNSIAECGIHPAKRDLFSKGPIVIGNRVWVGENVVILPGVKIGNESVIGANSVVTKDIPDRCVAAGNPAKIIRMID